MTSAGVLFTCKGKCLLAHSTNSRRLSSWMPPKGHLESGESPELAALREVEEEIGWKLTHVDSNRFFDVPYIDRKGVTYKTVRCFVVELESEDPDNNGPHLKRVAGLQKEEVDEIRWFNRTEVATYALPRYVEFIKAVL